VIFALSASPCLQRLAVAPNLCLLLFTLGFALICVELNRPGLVLPGATGLLLSLLTIASLARLELSPGALVLIATAWLLLLLGLRRNVHSIVSAAATLALILGFYRLTPVEPRIHPITALVSGLFLGIGTSILTRIARRARVNKGLD
jgi:membrane-bound ClpP family serine protease